MLLQASIGKGREQSLAAIDPGSQGFSTAQYVVRGCRVWLTLPCWHCWSLRHHSCLGGCCLLKLQLRLLACPGGLLVCDTKSKRGTE